MRYLYLTHRWLGLIFGPLIVLWLLSGIVMLFVSYPSLTIEEQLSHLQPLQRSLVNVLPETAWQSLLSEKGSITSPPENTQLAMQQARPVYYFLANQYWHAVWADTAKVVAIDHDVAIKNALDFEPAVGIKRVALIQLDQWSFSGKLNPHRPLYKVSLDNAAQSEIYISSRTGQVVLETNKNERLWNWLGSITHWIYFTELRAQRELWRQVILWPAGIGIALSAIGVWMGITRMRITSRYSRNRHTPYRGMLRLHHIVGYGFGLILVTWLFSGWLSMTPMNWLSDRTLSSEELNAWQGKTIDLHDYVLPSIFPSGTKLLEWKTFMGEPVLISHLSISDQRLHLKTGEQLPAYSLKQLSPAVHHLQTSPLATMEWLPVQGDAYYRPENNYATIARTSFSDDENVSYYINAMTSEIVASQDTRSRYYRWLFTALHTWNFPGIEPQFWRKILIIMLSIFGLTITLTGLYHGSKRLIKRR